MDSGSVRHISYSLRPGRPMDTSGLRKRMALSRIFLPDMWKGGERGMGEQKTDRLFVDSGACQNGEGIARLTAEPAEHGEWRVCRRLPARR